MPARRTGSPLLFAHLAADKLAVASIQNPLRLDPFNEPQPDLMLLRYRQDFYEQGHPTVADVLLLIEISDSSPQYHSGLKLDLYARHDVSEVWILDLVGRSVEICRGPVAGVYKRRRKRGKGLVAPTFFPDTKIDLNGLLA